MVLLMVFLAPSAARDKRTENVGVQTKAIWRRECGGNSDDNDSFSLGQYLPNEMTSRAV
jgi:hypothetical protein